MQLWLCARHHSNQFVRASFIVLPVLQVRKLRHSESKWSKMEQLVGGRDGVQTRRACLEFLVARSYNPRGPDCQGGERSSCALWQDSGGPVWTKLDHNLWLFPSVDTKWPWI